MTNRQPGLDRAHMGLLCRLPRWARAAVFVLPVLAFSWLVDELFSGGGSVWVGACLGVLSVLAWQRLERQDRS